MNKYFNFFLVVVALFFINSNTAEAKQPPFLPDFIHPERIEIVRDSFGVPHIFAPTDAEVAYGLAWCTLEDDFETTITLLYSAKNAMGRFKGVDGAIIDYAVQLMRIEESLSEKYETDISDDFKKILEGYAAGANSYIYHHWDEMAIKKAYPITPQDIVGGYMLGMGLMGGIDGVLKAIVDGSIVDDLPQKEPNVGSNAFAMNRFRTADSSVYLVVNSHQPLEGLLSWYEAHLVSEEGLNIIGGLFHGGISIFHGTNQNLGWAHTTGHVDSKDVFKLEMHPKKKKFYKYGEEYKKLDRSFATLKVGLGKRKNFRLVIWKKYWNSEFGPTLKTKHGTYAIKMPGMSTVKAPEQWFKMNKAKNFTEFKSIVEGNGVAHQNITYADKNDTIYFLANGIFGKRPLGYPWNKVVETSDPKLNWTEFHPVADMAQVLNPKEGFVFNVNNSDFDATAREDRLNPEDFPPYMGYENNDNNRSNRVHTWLREHKGDKIDWQEWRDLKFSHVYPADSFVFLKDFKIDLFYNLSAEDHPEIAKSIHHIQNWNNSADSLNTDFPITLFSMYEIYNRSDKEMIEKIESDDAEKEKFFVDCILVAQNHMMKHFGRLDVPLGRVSRIERGGISYPLNGAPDMLRAVASNKMENGRLRSWVGDSYIQMVNFPLEGDPIVRTVSPFGASNKPTSNHYTDQMEMYAKEQFKIMSFDKETVLKEAEQIYHPK